LDSAATLLRVSSPERLMDGVTLSRRRALAWLGGLGLAAVVPGCADDDPGATPTTSVAQGPADCVLMPELTEGPYYLDLDVVRRDITEGRPGAPFDLAVTVVDADSCEPIEGAAVDVWHCDAEGVYSGVQGDSGTFLRGVQMTGADGVASFRTIFPGWYTGRAVHVHLKVALGTTDVHTGQLFFDEATLAAAYESEPYAGRGAPDMSKRSGWHPRPKRRDDRHGSDARRDLPRVGHSRRAAGIAAGQTAALRKLFGGS
jgi:protocatechuate 3,4-dioxygenase beta subunit